VKRFKLNFEAHVMRANNVLDGEIRQVDVGVSNFLELLCVVLGGGLRFLLGFGSSADHFARLENEGSRFWLSDSHDCRGKTFWLVLDILSI
jgi:hypothetical protein